MARQQTFLVSARLSSRTLQNRLDALPRQLADRSISVRISSNIAGSLLERRVSLDGGSRAVEEASKLLISLLPEGGLIPIFDQVETTLSARALLLDHFLLMAQDRGNKRRLTQEAAEKIVDRRLEQNWLSDFARVEGPNLVLRDFVEPMIRSQRQFQLQRIGVR